MSPRSCDDSRPRSRVMMESIPGTARNTEATDERAAMVSGWSEKWRRTSRIAGSAITASPSQFGATTSIPNP